jgi:hypothetical protein|tara:strand:- start:52934 stop:53077 length:144 start_codon:yes stop_codon:yes gene_type:complete
MWDMAGSYPYLGRMEARRCVVAGAAGRQNKTPGTIAIVPGVKAKANE